MPKPVNVAFIGAGRISDLHAIEYLRSSDANIRVVCDTRVEQSRQKTRAWGLKDVELDSDYRTTLERTDIDLVEILLPHHLHLSVALDAIKAGKAVSLQKPMCTSLTDADQLVEAAATAIRPVRIFENFMFYPPVVEAKKLVDSGVIGKPQSFRIKSNTGFGKNAWHVPPASFAWRQNESLNGGGPLVFDDGHHKFALAWYFMGQAEEVHAFIGRTDLGKGMFFDAPSQVSFLFAEGCIGNLEVVHSPGLEITGDYYAQDDRIEITGTKGVIWINGGHGTLGSVPPLVLYVDGETTEFTDIPTDWALSFVHATRNCIDALHDQLEPVLTPADAREILRFTLAAQESARLGKTVSLKNGWGI